MSKTKLVITEAQINEVREGGVLEFRDQETGIAWWETRARILRPDWARYWCFIDEEEERVLRAGGTVALPGNKELSLCNEEHR